ATGVALLAAAYLVMAPTADHRPAEAVRRGAATIAVRALVSLAIVAGAIAVGRSVLALHYLNQGKGDLRAHPVQAIRKANDSLALNGDSLEALYLESAGFARLDDYPRARAAVLEATEIEP